MAETATTLPEVTAAKPRILVVDDSKLVRKTATKILSDKFDLVLAEDGEDAWGHIEKDDTIQVVFTDLGMPNLDGYGLLQRIRQSNNECIRDLPVIVITGAAEEESVRKEVFEIGATDFIGKPFKSTEIIARADTHATYRQTKTKLQKHTDIDVLTGTLNRHGVDQKLEKDVSFVNRHKQSLALVIFELDNFAEIASKVKQKGAEKIVQQIAKLLGKAIRKEDSFGRYERAKFITILPMAKPEGVVQLSKRLSDHVKSVKLKMAGESIELTMSAGIAALTKGSQTSVEQLMKTAEKALKTARAVKPGDVQILKLESIAKKAPVKIDVSIDALLDSIAQGKSDLDKAEIAAAVEKLLPLAKQFSVEQKKQLLQ